MKERGKAENCQNLLIHTPLLRLLSTFDSTAGMCSLYILIKLFSLISFITSTLANKVSLVMGKICSLTSHPYSPIVKI